MTAITIRPIRADLPFGARVGGVTLTTIDDPAVCAQLVDAFERSGLLIFDDVEPSAQLQVAISTVFGPLKDHPSKQVARADGDLLGVIEMRYLPTKDGTVRIGGQELAQWLPWHFDHCYTDELNRGGVLRAIESTADGGMTGFTDGIALHRGLSAQLQERLDSVTVAYAMDVLMGNLVYGRPSDLEVLQEPPQAAAVMKEYAGRPRALHPAVWTRSTGEKVLHVSPWMAKGVEGFGEAEAHALLLEVSDAIVELSEGLSYLHEWRPDQMVIWDNWRVLHRVSGSPPEQGRCMHRTTIAGDYGLGRLEALAPV
jgi:taurine dioxygenase